MMVAVGILGALAIVCYITGMVLVIYSGKDSNDTLQKAVASWLMIIGWILTCVFALLGDWKENPSVIFFLSIVAVWFPILGLMLRKLERRWIPSLFVLLGLLATPVLYILLLIS